VFLNHGRDLFKEFPSFDSCKNSGKSFPDISDIITGSNGNSTSDGNGNNDCYDKFAVLRTSFVHFIFSVSIGLWCFRENLDQHDFHSKKWFRKFLFMIFLFVIAFLIPNDFFLVYAQIIRILAGIFILCQILAYLETAYLLNERWLDSPSRHRHIKPLVVSLIVYALTITGIVLMYKWYENCKMGEGFLVTITILCILFLIMSFVLEKASILISAIMSIFVIFYTHSAFVSQPSDECNNDKFQSKAEGIEIFFSIIIIIGSLVLTVTSAVLTPQSLGLNPKDKYNYVYFHMIMSLGMSYATMVLISWSLSNTSSDGLDNSWISFWVKISAALLACLLYLISLLAPVIFKNREFDRKSVTPNPMQSIP
jgi:hypothetical protein